MVRAAHTHRPGYQMARRDRLSENAPDQGARGRNAPARGASRDARDRFVPGRPRALDLMPDLHGRRGALSVAGLCGNHLVVFGPDHAGAVFTGDRGADGVYRARLLPDPDVAGGEGRLQPRPAQGQRCDARRDRDSHHLGPRTNHDRRDLCIPGNGCAMDRMIAALIFSFAFGAMPAFAGVRAVTPENFSRALSEAQPGDTLRLAPGIYRGPFVVSTPSLRIVGERDVVIDGGGNGMTMTLAADDVGVEGVTIRHSGGDLANNDAVVLVRDAHRV